MTKWMSRKFIVTMVQILIMILLPIVYKSLDIVDEITMTMLIAIAASGSFYTGFNVLQKKFESNV